MCASAMTPRRVAYVVSVPQFGAGGHYHSLAAIVGGLRDAGAVDAAVIVIGRATAPAVAALAQEGVAVSFLEFTGLQFPGALLAVCKVCRDIRAEVIHAFDEHAYLFARLAAWRLGIGCLLTKCGGGHPRRYFPSARHLTVFSREDREFFTRRNGSAVRLLPNRVRSVRQDASLIAELRSRLPGGQWILRISRIARHYEKTLRDSINLLKRLRGAGCDARLLIVGTVYDEQIFARLRETAGDGVTWVTDPRIASDAKRIIDIADIVIGTGRSLMEAAVRRRTVLCPVANLEIPCLVTAENIEQLANFNFSERCSVNTDDFTEFSAIVARLQSGQSAGDKRFLEEFASQHCDVSAVVGEYADLYAGVAVDPEPATFDVLPHAAKVAFVFWRAGRKIRRDRRS